MSVLRKWPIARMVPVVAVVLFVASVLAVALAVVQQGSTKDAEADLQRHIEAQLQVDRFAILDVTAKYNNALARGLPADRRGQQEGRARRDRRDGQAHRSGSPRPTCRRTSVPRW